MAKLIILKIFFGKKVGLTVSGQLEAEALVMGLNRVYTFGPTFRAENSNTTRHASEFWMMEPEMAFADLNDDMNLAEKMIKYLISYVLKELPEEMEFFNKFIDTGLLERLNNILNSDFVRLPYTEAIDLLIKSGEKFRFLTGSGRFYQGAFNFQRGADSSLLYCFKIADISIKNDLQALKKTAIINLDKPEILGTAKRSDPSANFNFLAEVFFRFAMKRLNIDISHIYANY